MLLLILLAVQGMKSTMDQDRLGELIQKYGNTILRIAFAYMKDRQKAEDVCQDVYVKLYCSDPSFDSEEHEKAWLIRVTINLCKDMHKSAWNQKMVLTDTMVEQASTQDEPSEELERRADAQELFDLVSSLDDQFKSVIILYYYQQMSTKEIASTLKIPESTVRTRLMRARNKLQTLLAEVK